jgi:predicted outer membrane lipoprotein
MTVTIAKVVINRLWFEHSDDQYHNRMSLAAHGRIVGTADGNKVTFRFVMEFKDNDFRIQDKGKFTVVGPKLFGYIPEDQRSSIAIEIKRMAREAIKTKVIAIIADSVVPATR